MILAAFAVLALTDQPVITADRGQGHVPAPTAAEETVAPSLTTPSITAPRATTTDEQIAAWIGASPAAPMQAGDEPIPYDAPFQPDRRITGEVGVAVGSHGYRAFDIQMGAPLGETGFIALHYGQSEGGRAYLSPYPYRPYRFGVASEPGYAPHRSPWDPAYPGW